VGPGLTAANLHLNTVVPNFLIQELFFPDKPLHDEMLADNFPTLRDGCVDVPARPGPGIDEKAVTRAVHTGTTHPAVISGNP
jgi:L-alanine-DL-glutamate epimerase-like enolase superfamily enzyme